jgi:heme o synthase
MTTTIPTIASTNGPIGAAASGAKLAPSREAAWWEDYAALTKPRILMMILLTVAIGMVAFSHKSLHWLAAIHTLLGTALIASSASVLNQWLEADFDARMPRTANRPLPSGRLTSFEASLFGWLTGGLGFAYLWLLTNPMATLVGLVTWVTYVWLYTPMKRFSWWNTAVGTLPGALPVMIGWTSAGGSVFAIEGWLLTSIVILWQFPHFMAIAWLYKDQYDLAGYKMITNTERTGNLAAWHAIIPAVILIPLSVVVLQPAGIFSWMLAILGAASCLLQVVASWNFMKLRENTTARKLLHSSLIYLPAIMLLVLIRSLVA